MHYTQNTYRIHTVSILGITTTTVTYYRDITYRLHTDCVYDTYSLHSAYIQTAILPPEFGNNIHDMLTLTLAVECHVPEITVDDMLKAWTNN
jgi:hypothetical protein